MENYYLVKAQFGHVGRNCYIVKTIPVYAENGKEAATFVRWMPRVKHDRKDAIIEVKKCTYDEYLNQKEINSSDSYFQVCNRQQQNLLCEDIEKQIISYQLPNNKISKIERINKIKYKMKKNKIIYKEAANAMKNYEALLAY